MAAEESGSLSFDRIAKQYDESRGGAQRARAAAEAIAALLPAPATLPAAGQSVAPLWAARQSVAPLWAARESVAPPVLEIGVGTGIVAAELASQGFRIVGVDLSPAMLSRAAARLPGRVALANAGALPVASGSIAAAYAVQVLQVVGDPEPLLAEAARVLRPGGRLVTTVSTKEAPPDNDVSAVLGELEAAIGRPAERPDDEERVLALAGQHGLRLVDRGGYVSGQGLMPREVASRVVERSWSWMWRCDDDTWRRGAQAALERLAAMPDQDVPPGSAMTYPLVALESLHRS
jgi:SAM-dependent methyltransferase